MTVSKFQEGVDGNILGGATGNPALGIRLALVAALLWGWLPIALSALLGALDAITITWIRFTVAAVIQNFWLWATHRSPWPWPGNHRSVWIALFATLGLIGNYVLAASSLHFLTPDASILVAQAQPLLLIVAGGFVFSETLSRIQGVGIALLACGLLLFFHRSAAGLLTSGSLRLSGIGWGIAMAMGGAFSWAAYAVLQRMLRRTVSPQQTLAVLYAGASLLLWPWARPSSMLSMDSGSVCLLVFCIANTLLAYGAFAQAMANASAAVVGAVIAQSPLVTIATLASIAAAMPSIAVPGAALTPIAWLGVLFVVGGCTMCVSVRPHARGQSSTIRDHVTHGKAP